MEEAQEVTLDAATSSDDALLSNLLELYIHDLSAPFPDIEMGANGRFGYRKLPLYWSEPDRRFAFVIRCGGRLAGFALATRGSPVTEDPDVLDVAEFFVLRRYRRAGVGRQAAFLLWNRLPGKWTVRVFEGGSGCGRVLDERHRRVHARHCDRAHTPWRLDERVAGVLVRESSACERYRPLRARARK